MAASEAAAAALTAHLSDLSGGGGACRSGFPRTRIPAARARCVQSAGSSSWSGWLAAPSQRQRNRPACRARAPTNERLRSEGVGRAPRRSASRPPTRRFIGLGKFGKWPRRLTSAPRHCRPVAARFRPRSDLVSAGAEERKRDALFLWPQPVPGERRWP